MDLKVTIYEATKAIKEYSDTLESLIKEAREHVNYGDYDKAYDVLTVAIKMMEE
jgi:hypothetical protein